MGVVGGGRLAAGDGKVAGRACPAPTGVAEDCRAACPQAAADVHGCGDSFGPSL